MPCIHVYISLLLASIKFIGYFIDVLEMSDLLKIENPLKISKSQYKHLGILDQEEVVYDHVNKVVIKDYVTYIIMYS